MGIFLLAFLIVLVHALVRIGIFKQSRKASATATRNDHSNGWMWGGISGSSHDSTSASNYDAGSDVRHDSGSGFDSTGGASTDLSGFGGFDSGSSSGGCGGGGGGGGD